MTAVDLPPWLLRPTTSRYPLPPSTTPTQILYARSDPVSSPSCPIRSAEVPAIAAVETAQPLYHHFKPLHRAHYAPIPPSPSSSCSLRTDILQLTARFKAHMDQLFDPFEARITAKIAQLEQQPVSKLSTIIPCQPHSFPPQSSNGCEKPLISTSKANVQCKRRSSDLYIHDHDPSFIFDLLIPPSSSSRAYNHNFDASLQYPPSQPHYHRTNVERCTDMTKLVRTWLQKIPDLYEHNSRRTLQILIT